MSSRRVGAGAKKKKKKSRSGASSGSSSHGGAGAGSGRSPRAAPSSSSRSPRSRPSSRSPRAAHRPIQRSVEDDESERLSRQAAEERAKAEKARRERERRQREEEREREKEKQRAVEEEERRKAQAAAHAADDDDDDYDDDFDSYSEEDFEDDDEDDGSPIRSHTVSKSPLDGLTFGVKSSGGPRMPGPKSSAPLQTVPPIPTGSIMTGAVTHPHPGSSGAGAGAGAGASANRASGAPVSPRVRQERERARQAELRRLEAARPKARNVAGIKHPKAKRVDFLTARIELSEDSAELYAQAPVPPYDLYLNQLRASTIRQTAQQTNDDARTQEVQTETTPWCHKSMQFPDDLGVVGTTDKVGTRDTTVTAADRSAQALRLLKFLRRTTAVMETLLDENVDEAEAVVAAEMAAKGAAAGGAGVGGVGVFGEAPVGIGATLPYLEGRRVVDVAFSSSRPNDVLVAYTAIRSSDKAVNGGFRHTEQKADAASEEASVGGGVDAGEATRQLARGGLLCLWDLNDASAPRMVFVCAGTPTCCTLSPGRSHVAIAGTEEGSIVLWDLREPASQHVSSTSAVLGIPSGLRQPTYSTDAIPSSAGHHCCRVCKVVPVVASSESGMSSSSSSSSKDKDEDGSGSGAGAGGAGESKSDDAAADTKKKTKTSKPGTASVGTSTARLGTAEGDSTRVSFQIASMDDRGLVNVWVAVELPGSEWVSEVDFGLGIGGRLKLIKTSTVHAYIAAIPDAEEIDPVSFDIDNFGPSVEAVSFCPSDPNRFLVASTCGGVLNRSRFGDTLSPQVYMSPETLDVPVTELPPSFAPALSVDFCPWSPSHFLVGYQDGVVALFSSETSLPLTHWDVPRRGSDQGVIWVKWAACAPGVFFAVDSSPAVHVWNLHINDKAPVTSQALDPAVTGLVAVASSDSTRRARKMSIAFGSDSGTICVYRVGPQFLDTSPTATNALRAKLQTIV